MKVSILDLHCLNALCDDYENVASVLEEVRRSSHGNVHADEVIACLCELARDGMVTAYTFDATSARYVPTAAIAKDCESAWFHISDRGRRELDANWVDE